MIDRLINSSLLIASILILRGVLGKYLNRRFTYAMWLVVAVQLLLPISVGNPFLFSHAVQTYWTVATDGAEHGTAGEDGFGGVSAQEQINGQISQVQLTQDARKTQNGQQSSEQTQPLSSGQPAVFSGIKKLYAGWNVFLPAVWIAGMVAVGGCLAVSNLLFAYKLRKNRTLETTYQGRKVYTSTQVESPCLYGLFLPAIYLPEGCVLTEEQQNHILLHEWTHYRHGDNIWALIRSLILTIYWFDPLVWAACHFSRKDCETACDEGVLKILTTQERLQYGRTLVDLCAMLSGHSATWLVAQEFGGGKQELKYRLNFIRQPKAGRLVGMLAAGCVLFLAAGCTLGGQSVEQDAGQSSDQDIYMDTVMGLPDETQFAFIDLGLQHPVLLTTDQTYDDRNGHNAAVYCDVYYETQDGKVQKLGRVESSGTAYPILYFENQLLTAGGWGMRAYVIDEEICALKEAWNFTVALAKENGEEIYLRNTKDTQEVLTEEAYLPLMENIFDGSEIVSFATKESD